MFTDLKLACLLDTEENRKAQQARDNFMNNFINMFPTEEE